MCLMVQCSIIYLTANRPNRLGKYRRYISSPKYSIYVFFCNGPGIGKMYHVIAVRQGFYFRKIPYRSTFFSAKQLGLDLLHRQVTITIKPMIDQTIIMILFFIQTNQLQLILRYTIDLISMLSLLMLMFAHLPMPNRQLSFQRVIVFTSIFRAQRKQKREA